MIPKSYRIQDGCHNCRHVFKRYEYDSPEDCFCTRLSKRPIPCCSVAMGESNTDLPKNKQWKAYKTWMEWSQKHLVDRAGTCPFHITMPKENDDER